jgi:hypothetical protein
MPHTHEPIITCAHIMERANHRPDVLAVFDGKVEFAVCFDCADETNERHAAGNTKPLDTFKVVCAEHAQRAGIPVTAKMADGFYAWENERWVKQPEVEDTLN